MSYEVLARRLRPSGFDALVGQSHVVRALTHALDNDRLHHAYLFTGTRGVGKTTIARILAKSLNCEQGVSASPCGECSICLEVKENRFIDLIEVDAASRTGVDDTRELLENAQYMPTRGRYKVYLIDEVHMLSVASFNALLKTLEEPPGHVKFLLATTDPRKVPATVLSRCLQFQLKNLSAQEIQDYLQDILEQEQVVFEPEALRLVAQAARGSMRDALSLTDQGISYGQGQLLEQDIVGMLGLVGRDQIGSLMQALHSGSAQQLMALSDELAGSNVSYIDVLDGFIAALHEAAVTTALGTGEALFPADELQLYYQIALTGRRDMTVVPDHRSGFEMTLLRMLAFAPEPDSVVAPRGAKPSPLQEAPSAKKSESTAVFAATGTSPKAAPAPDSTGLSKGEGSATSGQPRADGSTNVTESSAKGDAKIGLTAVNGAATAGALRLDSHSELAEEAFAPLDSAKITVGPGDEAASVIRGDASGAVMTEAQSSADAKAASIVGASNTIHEQWYEWVEALAVEGVARMLAEHSLAHTIALPTVALILQSSHDTLLSDAQRTNLERALAEVVGAAVKLTISVGELDSETPAERKARLFEIATQEAEATLRNDALVQKLMTTFGAKLDNVRPIQD
tara:strand:- start:1922 stop:3805 length:1884 start_codon:yes stop_codon:yes gene_type:complete